jgi:predicted TPR repeat methyltransferase
LTERAGPEIACPCGSGRNYQQCCLGRERERAVRLREAALGELANGRPAAALTALRRALTLSPDFAAAQETLGVTLEDLQRVGEAEAAYREALRLDPTCTIARQNLGQLLRRLGRFEEAASCFREVLARRPQAFALLMEFGATLWKIDDVRGALEAFQRAVAVSPGSAEAHYNQRAGESLRLQPGFTEGLLLNAAALAATGQIDLAVGMLDRLAGREVSLHERYVLLATRLMSSKLFEPARRCLQEALREEPDEVMARHLLAALSGENPERPTDGYVRRLFDTSAAGFDENLITKLGYGIPQEMAAALLSLEDTPARPWDVLDLGCGTGLVGVELAAHSRRLVGVDLAPNMIAQARKRNSYTDLHCADIMAALAADAGHYHVVTAGDVFIYVGRLDGVIPEVRRVLKSGGLFAFSAEAAEAMDGAAEEGYRLGIMGRYAHSATYLRQLAARNRFRVEQLQPVRIRFEHRRPVQGWLTIWRAA